MSTLSNHTPTVGILLAVGPNHLQNHCVVFSDKLVDSIAQQIEHTLACFLDGTIKSELKGQIRTKHLVLLHWCVMIRKKKTTGKLPSRHTEAISNRNRDV